MKIEICSCGRQYTVTENRIECECGNDDLKSQNTEDHDPSDYAWHDSWFEDTRD